MEYIWSSSSHETPRQHDIILPYTDCQFDHSLNIPHDCIYDLETCGLFEPSGPRGSPEFTICAACHYPHNSHPKVTSTPLHHIMARSPPLPYYPAPLHHEMAHSLPQLYPAHQGEASTWLAPEMTRSPPRPYPAHRGEASTWHAPEMTHSPLPYPQPASEPGLAESQPVRNLTPDRSKRLRDIAKNNNYRALKDYTKAEAQQICAELGIKKKCLSDWISRHNLARKQAAKDKAAAKEKAARKAAAKEKAARKAAAKEEAAREAASNEETASEVASNEDAASEAASSEEAGI